MMTGALKKPFFAVPGSSPLRQRLHSDPGWGGVRLNL